MPEDWLDYGMETGVVLGRGCAQPLGFVAGCRLRRGAGRRRVGAEAGERPADDSLPGLEEEIRVVRLFGIRRGRRGPPVRPGAALVMRCRRRLTSGGVVVVMGVLGPGGLAALLLVPARPVPHVLLGVVQVTRLPVSLVAPLRAGVTVIPRVRVSRLAGGSPRARLALLRPARVLAASSSGGLMLGMLSAVAPVVSWSAAGVCGPAVEPRWSQQGGGGLAFGQRGAHRPLSLAWRAKWWSCWRLEVEQRKKEAVLRHVQVLSISGDLALFNPRARTPAWPWWSGSHLTDVRCSPTQRPGRSVWRFARGAPLTLDGCTVLRCRVPRAVHAQSSMRPTSRIHLWRNEPLWLIFCFTAAELCLCYIFKGTVRTNLKIHSSSTLNILGRWGLAWCIEGPEIPKWF